jgi:hypothetical protein
MRHNGPWFPLNQVPANLKLRSPLSDSPIPEIVPCLIGIPAEFCHTDATISIDPVLFTIELLFMNYELNPEAEREIQADLERYQKWLRELLASLLSTQTQSAASSHLPPTAER